MATTIHTCVQEAGEEGESGAWKIASNYFNKHYVGLLRNNNTVLTD